MDGRTDGSVTISLRNFIGEGIIKHDPYFTFYTGHGHSANIIIGCAQSQKIRMLK